MRVARSSDRPARRQGSKAHHATLRIRAIDQSRHYGAQDSGAWL